MKFLEDLGVNVAYVLIPMALFFFYLAVHYLVPNNTAIFSYLIAFAPLYLPPLTFIIFFETWLNYVRTDFNIKQGRVTLEVKLPQEIFKSPAAMELVFSQIHQTASPDNHIQTYWDGKNPPTYSLELVSRGGDVRFYINTPRKKFKNLIETQLYAQYPGIEIQELDLDYTAEIPWDPKTYSYFSLHFGLKKEDALPIKTYIEYGLDKNPKEEEKVDPITTLIEALGSLGPGEHMWVQILITANRETNFKTGSLTASPDWKSDARKHIMKIVEESNKRIGVEKKEGQPLNMMNVSQTEQETIKAIERSLSKNAFDTVIRGMYIAPSDNFQIGERVPALIAGWRAYDDISRNSIGPRWRTDFDWPWWQDRKGKKREALKKQELAEYKRRAYTSQNKADKPKVFTTEELATLYHLPGKVALTPSLARLPSKRAEPPPNLPVG